MSLFHLKVSLEQTRWHIVIPCGFVLYYIL